MSGSVAPEVHISELKAFKRCRRKWALSEIAWIAPQKLSMPLLLGSAIHEGLAEWHTNGDIDVAIETLDSYFDQEVAPLQNETPWLYVEQEADILEAQELGRIMLAGYAERYANEEFKVAKAGGKHLLEIPFREPIIDPSTDEQYVAKYPWGDGGKVKRIRWEFTGTMDGIVVDEYGYWILERKTTKDTNADYLRLDDQNAAYMASAVRQWPKLDGQLRGVLYDFLRKQKPGPRVKSPLYFRERIYRNRHEADAMTEQVFYVVKDMETVMRDPDRCAYPTPTRDCSWDCSYRPICMAMNNGADVQMHIESSYKYQQGRMMLPKLWTPQNRG